MTTVSVTGIGAQFYVPGQWQQIVFNQGEAGGQSGPREVVFYSPMTFGITGAGTGTANTKYECKNTADAETYAGSGSPGHRAAMQHFKVPGSRRFWLVPYNSTTGGGPSAAYNTVTVGGSTGATGTAHLFVCGEDCSFVYGTTDTTDTVATGLRAQIANKTWLPVTCGGTGPAITTTAKIPGISMNGAIKVRSRVDGASGFTLNGAADLAGGADGSTTEATNLASAMAAVGSTSGLYYHVWGGAGTTACGTAITNMKTAINTRSAANPGLRAVAIVASRETLANATTVANTQNYERIQVVWQESSEWDPASIVGNVAAIRCAHENDDSAYNFAGFGTRGEADWLVPPAYLDSDWPTVTEQNTAITEGITPINSTPSGTYIVMSVDTRAKTSGVYDFRSTETHRVSVADDFAAVCGNRFVLNFSGKKLRDDVKLSDGSVDPNQPRTRGVVTPSQVRGGVINKTLREFYDDGKIQDVENSILTWDVHKSTVNSARVESEGNLRAIDHCNQFVGKINETSTG